MDYLNYSNRSRSSLRNYNKKIEDINDTISALSWKFSCSRKKDRIRIELGMVKISRSLRCVLKDLLESIRRSPNRRLDPFITSFLSRQEISTSHCSLQNKENLLDPLKSVLSDPDTTAPSKFFKVIHDHSVIDKSLERIGKLYQNRLSHAFDLIFLSRGVYDSISIDISHIRNNELSLAGAFGNPLNINFSASLNIDDSYCESPSADVRILVASLDKLVYKRIVRGFYALVDALYSF